MKNFDWNKYCMDALFRKIPEINNLEEPLKSEFDWYKKDDPLLTHCIYESVLCPYFLLLIKRDDEQSKDTVKRIVELIEELANHKDFEVRCVAQVSFCEPLLYKLKPPKDIEKYLLPKSLELAKQTGWDIFGLDHRIGWKSAVEWYRPYEEYFGMIANKPDTNDQKLQTIYNQLYDPTHDKMPGGIAQMMKWHAKKGSKQVYLPEAERLLIEITKRIEDKNNPLQESDLETVQVIMYNLRDSIKLAKGI